MINLVLIKAREVNTTRVLRGPRITRLCPMLKLDGWNDLFEKKVRENII